MRTRGWHAVLRGGGGVGATTAPRFVHVEKQAVLLLDGPRATMDTQLITWVFLGHSLPLLRFSCASNGTSLVYTHLLYRHRHRCTAVALVTRQPADVRNTFLVVAVSPLFNRRPPRPSPPLHHNDAAEQVSLRPAGGIASSTSAGKGGTSSRPCRRGGTALGWARKTADTRPLSRTCWRCVGRTGGSFCALSWHCCWRPRRRCVWGGGVFLLGGLSRARRVLVAVLHPREVRVVVSMLPQRYTLGCRNFETRCTSMPVLLWLSLYEHRCPVPSTFCSHV